MGNAIAKAVSLTEIIKRSLDENLHQINTIGMSKEVKNSVNDDGQEYEHVVHIPSIHITLSLDQLDSNALGYQYHEASSKTSSK